MRRLLSSLSVASRQEEKERKRQERLEREAAEARAAGRRKRLQLVGGTVLALGAVAAVVIALVVGLGGDDAPAGPKAPPESTNASVKLPAAAETDLRAAAKAAGCTLTNAKFEGQNHQEKQFTPADYQTNPPTSGDHTPNWYEDGIYAPGTTPDLGQLVHTLEHGRINVQYRPGTDAKTVAQLEAFVGENEGYHMVMYENTTKMPYAVAATAWTQSLTCDEMRPEVFDALRTFRDEYLDKGPEKIP